MKKTNTIRKSFTLVELLIVLFLFSVVATITLSSVTTSFFTGRLASNETKQLNQNLNLVFQTITQKMANANAKQPLSGGMTTVYGFKVINSVLIIASKDQCTLIGKKDTALYLKQSDCNKIAATFGGSGGITPGDINNFDASDKISSNDIKITSLTFPDYNEYEYSPSDKTVPFITINIAAADVKDEVASTMQSSYGINYDTVKNNF